MDRILLSNFAQAILDGLQRYQASRNVRRSRQTSEPQDRGVLLTTNETLQQWESTRRQLLILLDQAVLAKSRFSRAFPRKAKEFPPDAAQRYNLTWHPGWRDPEPYVPATDADPFRGACGVSSCLCDLFETPGPPYIYHPDHMDTNPDRMLCARCLHPKVEHKLATTADRRKLKEFSEEHVEKYAVPASVAVSITGDEEELESTRKEHPADVPMYVLKEFYTRHPQAAGAGEVFKSIAMIDSGSPSSSSQTRSKSSAMSDLWDDEANEAEGFF
ncbi:Type II secretion system (T2SS)-associated protein Gcp6 [Andalucia godoyi]|uniref:Type II secretion system (T2SS)-associated protein Gcp6 n=1 Tax=Andalucia godoyi TaxID=505711 RepID=A0A8K0AIV2_ANDGO|nr:Type II secretion system (T2SS)-associated protein Gcp6 [Andalucia godoyi]|eukprot:ANDGO_04770.mRNA.1 Type II secretion system (T2SS)-associated protein Gcp6